jgi:glycogen operon protein
MRYSDYLGSGMPDVSWHGTQAWKPDWSGSALAFLLCGRHARGGTAQDDHVYVAMNMHWQALPFELPHLPAGRHWHVFANTSMPSPEDVHEPGQEPCLGEQGSFLVGERSVVVLVAR